MTTYSAVITTGIYCRPGCRARPKAENVRTFELAAAAEAAGFRACLRCRPYRIVGSPPWDAPELVCRAVQMIIAGALDEGTEDDLSARLGLSSRHLRRLFHEHLGLTPDQLARSRRAHFARRLLDDTDLTIADIAFASGFGSLRQFNRTMHETFRSSPQKLRQRRQHSDRLVADGGLALRIPISGPYDWDAMLGFLMASAIPGVEIVQSGTYRRVITLDGAPGLLEVSQRDSQYLLLQAHLPYWEGLIHVVERLRHLLGLDVDATQISQLVSDQIIGPIIATRPGLRFPGTWGPFETGVQVIVGQTCRSSEASTYLGGIARTFGVAVAGLGHGLTHAFPGPETLAQSDMSSAGLPSEIAEVIQSFARAVSAGHIRLDGSVKLDDLVESMTSIPGIDACTASHVAMRLGERDAFPHTDQQIIRSLRSLAEPIQDPMIIAERWQPWRAVAATYLLSSQITS